MRYMISRNQTVQFCLTSSQGLVSNLDKYIFCNVLIVLLK